MNTYTVVGFDPNLRDVHVTDTDTLPVAYQGLVTEGLYIVTGAPTATAGKYIAGAKVTNLVTGIIYFNTGSTASPVFTALTLP